MEGRAGDDTTIAGALTRTSADGGFVSLRLGERREAEGPFGSAGRGALALGEARTDHATLHVERPLGPDTTLLATAGLGWARLEGARDGLVADAGDFLATSFALGLRHEGLFSTGDALALTVAQPLRAENAKVDLDLPVARTIDGRILRRRHSFDAGSGGREIDLEATYGMALDAHREVELGLLVRRHPDHDDRAPAEFAAAVRYLHRF